MLLCSKMGWDWEQYRRQPQWFVTGLFSMYQNEAEELARKAKS